jgi:hypothetical protein
MEIQRYDYADDGEHYNQEDGDFVLYADHLAEIEHYCQCALTDNQTIVDLKEQIAALTAENARYREALETVKRKYMELIYGVSKKFPFESRHQTALRYITERENQCSGSKQALKQAEGGGR